MNVKDIEELIRQAKFVHLEDDELRTLRDGVLDRICASRMLAHLRMCLQCEQRLAELREETLSGAIVWFAVLQAVTYSAHRSRRQFKDKPAPIHLLSADERRGVFINEEDNGDLIVTFGSRSQETEGKRFEMFLQEYPQRGWPFAFERQPDGQFKAVVRIPFAKRQTLPAGVCHFGVRELPSQRSREHK